VTRQEPKVDFCEKKYVFNATRAPTAKRDRVRALGATVLCLPTDAGGRVDLVSLLTALHQRGIGSVLVEGGARMITALLRARLVDRLAVCVAPKILGTGIEAVGALGIREIARSLFVTDTSVTTYGEDLVLEGRVGYPGAPPMTLETREDLGCITAS